MCARMRILREIHMCFLLQKKARVLNIFGSPCNIWYTSMYSPIHLVSLPRQRESDIYASGVFFALYAKERSIYTTWPETFTLLHRRILSLSPHRKYEFVIFKKKFSQPPLGYYFIDISPTPHLHADCIRQVWYLLMHPFFSNNFCLSCFLLRSLLYPILHHNHFSLPSPLIQNHCFFHHQSIPLPPSI